MTSTYISKRVTIFIVGLIYCFLLGFQTVLSSQDSIQFTNLFEDERILAITLSGDLEDLLKDKSEDPSYFPVELSYMDKEGNENSIAIRSKTRGNFRRLLGRCKYLPLWLNFDKSEKSELGIFEGQDKLKLVVPCKGEKYVIREYMAYKILNVLTPFSFRVRLVKLTLKDIKKDKEEKPFYAFLLESEKELAYRNNFEPVELKLRPQSLNKSTFYRLAVFEFLIGNTDWSVRYNHNIKLFSPDRTTLPYAVPYDFDHAGIVSAPYAKPAEGLGIRSVKDRIYRGNCIKNMDTFIPIIKEFNDSKEKIYSLYKDNSLFEKKYQKFVLKYLDSFYEIINENKKWHKYFSYPCDPNGTGNIVISGINRD